jgi:hypothetical protein
MQRESYGCIVNVYNILINYLKILLIHTVYCYCMIMFLCPCLHMILVIINRTICSDYLCLFTRLVSAHTETLSHFCLCAPDSHSVMDSLHAQTSQILLLKEQESLNQIIPHLWVLLIATVRFLRSNLQNTQLPVRIRTMLDKYQVHCPLYPLMVRNHSAWSSLGKQKKKKEGTVFMVTGSWSMLRAYHSWTSCDHSNRP